MQTQRYRPIRVSANIPIMDLNRLNEANMSGPRPRTLVRLDYHSGGLALSHILYLN